MPPRRRRVLSLRRFQRADSVASGDDAFSARIEETVEAMLDDGTLSTLSLKWFGIDMTAPALQ